MTQTALDFPFIPPAPSPAPALVSALAPELTPAPSVLNRAPGNWVEVPTPPPAVGDHLVDRMGRTAQVIAVRGDPGTNESIDLRLDATGSFIGLFAPTWWRDWRRA